MASEDGGFLTFAQTLSNKGANSRRATSLCGPPVHISLLSAEASATRGPIGANRKLAYASAFFNWCVDEGYLEANPCQRIRKPSRENVRDRFHSLDELREIWSAAGTLGYPFAQFYRLLIVLPNRREEVAGMPLDHLELGGDDRRDQGVWLLPGERTKMANALRVPLSSLARAIILEAIRHPDRPSRSKLVFTTTGDTPVSGFAKARRRLDGAIAAARLRVLEGQATGGAYEPMPHWTVHDLRTTFNTHACEMLDVPPHVADRILNHVATATRSKVMRIYNKSELFEPRRQALNAWADLLRERVLDRQEASVPTAPSSAHQGVRPSQATPADRDLPADPVDRHISGSLGTRTLTVRNLIEPPPGAPPTLDACLRKAG